MSIKNQLVGGAFQDVAGNPLANGYLIMQLSQDGQVNGNAQIGAGVEIKITLDSSGNVSQSPAQSVWPNDVISPAGTFYNVWAYTAQGQLVWGPNAQTVSVNPSPYNIGAWVPGATNVSFQPVTAYDIGSFFPGLPGSAVNMLLIPLERTVLFSANMIPSVASAGVAANGTAVFSIKKNGTQFATVTFSTGQAVGVFSATSSVVFNAGDVLTIVTPTSPDATLADIGILLSGNAVL